MSALLNVADVDAGYGDFQALFGIDLEVDEGELLALVGANGAGKSTLLRTIAGALKPFRGTVRFAGEDVTADPDVRRARKGIGLVPEGRRLFPSLTVEENLQVGAATGRKGPWNLAKVYEAMPLVADRRTRRAARLSGGEQQAVAIGRALMGNPRLLLLDEVSLGLAPLVVDQLYTALPGIRAEGTTVVLVEQDLNRTLAVADRIACVLEGRIVLTGRADRLTRDQVTAAYFGTGTLPEVTSS
ncbi:branched-chain amino acid transport system ATP-binding protein [Streptomyces sp. SAI-126]|jgi:branched-chain amino acid transport system ATP-binding protein|uniref:ABC transporter ATP-binding protein n=1 Tax=unclassified Streptomyces TaxID=2593676 RepID=UPI000F4ED92D|nr:MULTISPECIES: ABC transporter ATP-binding protein [unclassified Streptomyces]MDH6455645.1 branched-chain amino acid transport system ATP-binding protein [Streptomyces sp. SAI-119]QUC59243.1 ABC transporter ATP-binding protein [Streptomyces sp. A2-16]